MTTQRADFPPRLAQLKDGRIVKVRHGRAGDEAGIARLVASAFPVYARAARGDPDRAARSLAGELEPESCAVAELADGGRLIGASCMSALGRTQLGPAARVRRKLACWGSYGLLCFLLEKLRSRLLESRLRARPGELYRYLDAVDVSCRSLGVGRNIADFVEDYGRAAGYHTVSARHRSDNLPVLALHRKRGCVLVELPPTPLGRLLRLPAMLVSTRALSAATAVVG